MGYCQGMSEVAAVFLHEFSRGQPAGGGRCGFSAHPQSQSLRISKTTLAYSLRGLT